MLLEHNTPKLPGQSYDATKPKTWCRICGAVGQSDYDRQPYMYPHLGNMHTVAAFGEALRRLWSKAHAKTHTSQEHHSLAISGRQHTPEAAVRLHTYGVISLSDLATDPEAQNALSTATTTPLSDCEDTAIYAAL